MPTPRQCAECGASLPSDAPDGLCPTCGLRAALKVDPEAAAPFHPSALFDPPAKPAASPPPYPSLSPDGREGAQRAGEGAAEPQSAITRLRYFGDYELLEEIARGGMGVVYRARQVSLNRTVAVKMILAGQLASAADVQRFRAEAEAAARLQHANVVAIHEVGEHDGQHYFSMDYVEGRNLAQIIADGRLPVADFQRTARYVKAIAEAIHYAHQRGTLHRDLKPSNVLIDANDQPRITDFGLAKRLTSSELETQNSELTLSGQVLGSPNFIPPEQAAGKRGQVGPHSDVYSIGAILFHLLTARPPFLAETLSETLQQVQHTDPIAPRLLNPAVPRDLETICLKCLEKEPHQRYATAQSLADDLGHFLNGEPVEARPIGPAGKAARWCRRRPALAGALAACALVLVSGIAGITWQWRRAEQNAKNEERQRQRAEEHAARSQQVAQFLKDMLRGVKPSVARGRDVAMLREILDKTSERLVKDLKTQPGVEAELQETISDVYLGLGEYKKAETMSGEALTLRKKLLGPDHPRLAPTLNRLAEALLEQGRFAEAEALGHEALAKARKLPGKESLELANALNFLALLHKRQGRYPEAESLYREALAMLNKLFGPEDRNVASSMINLAGVLRRTGRPAEAEAMYRQALAFHKKVLGDEHPDVAALLNNLAALLDEQKKYPEAETMLRETLAMRQKLLGKEHPDVATSLNNLGTAISRQGRYGEAEALHREALAMRTRLLGLDHPLSTASLDNLAWVLNKQNKNAELEAIYSEALAAERKSVANDPLRLESRLNDLAENLFGQGKFAEAEPLYREFLDCRRARLSPGHQEVMVATANLARLLSQWAWEERTNLVAADVRRLNPNFQSTTEQSLAATSPLKRAHEGEQMLRDCLSSLLGSTNANHWRTAEVKCRLGAALLAVIVNDSSLAAEARQSKLAESETLLLEGNERLQRSKSADRKCKRDALERLVRLYEAWEAADPNNGKCMQAEEWKQKLAAFAAQEEEERSPN